MSDFELVDNASSGHNYSTDVISSGSINQWEVCSPTGTSSQQNSPPAPSSTQPGASQPNAWKSPNIGSACLVEKSHHATGSGQLTQDSSNSSMVNIRHSALTTCPSSSQQISDINKDSTASDLGQATQESSGVLVEKDSREEYVRQFCVKDAASVNETLSVPGRENPQKGNPVTCTMSSLPVVDPLLIGISPCSSFQSSGPMIPCRAVDLANAYKLQDLFRGRFTMSEAQLLLHKFNGNVQQTANYIFETEPKTLREHLQEDPENWVTPYVPTTTMRLYACGRCDKYWWTEALTRKPAASLCRHCQTRYDPVPVDREWGWAEFTCQSCQANFNGWCQMSCISPCLKCKQPVTPLRIKPPLERAKKRSADWRQHRCATCVGPNCAHPWTRLRKNLPKVLFPSIPHQLSNCSSTETMSSMWTPRDMMFMSGFSALSSFSGSQRDIMQQQQNRFMPRPGSHTRN